MKKIGLIGGTGPESTLIYYKEIVYGVYQKLNKKAFPELTVESINVFNVFKYCQEKDYAGLTQYLMTAIGNLEKAGAQVISLTGNTPHVVFDELRARTQTPLVSIIESTVEEAKKQQISKIGLLGTGFTMAGKFFKEPFDRENIDVILPTKNQQQYIAEKIATELEHGVFLENTCNEFINIMQDMNEQHGIERIVLGCTELPLLFENTILPLPTLDCMRIHIRDLIDLAL